MTTPSTPTSTMKEAALPITPDLHLVWNTLMFFAHPDSYTKGERTGGVLQGCPRAAPPTPEAMAGYAKTALAALCRAVGREAEEWMTGSPVEAQPSAVAGEAESSEAAYIVRLPAGVELFPRAAGEGAAAPSVEPRLTEAQLREIREAGEYVANARRGVTPTGLSEREAFEAWWGGQNAAPYYRGIEERIAWHAWQSRAAMKESPHG